MSAYKNLEIYQTAFNLAIKVYRLNVMLSVSTLLNQGNRLRWESLRIKDLIAEAFSGAKNDKEIMRNLLLAESACGEVINLMKKIRAGNDNIKQIQELLKNYKSLKKKINHTIQKEREDNYKNILLFPETLAMEVA